MVTSLIGFWLMLTISQPALGKCFTYLKTEGVITSCHFWVIFKKPTYDFVAFQDVRILPPRGLFHTVYCDKSRNSPAFSSIFWSQWSVDILQNLSGCIRENWMSEFQGRWNPRIFETHENQKLIILNHSKWPKNNFVKIKSPTKNLLHHGWNYVICTRI